MFFSREAVILISTLAIILVVFTSTSRFKISEILKYSPKAITLAIVFLVLNAVVLSTLTYYLFSLESFVTAVLFASLVYGIDAAITLSGIKNKKSKIAEILDLESVINRPLTVIVPLTIINLVSSPEGSSYIKITEQFLPFIQQFIVAIGVGVVLAVLVMLIINKAELGTLNYVVVVTAAILCFVMSEAMNGSGVFAVTLFGLLFGNYHIKGQLKVEKFIEIFSDSLQIIVLILIGTIIFVPADVDILIKGSLLFLGYLLIRFFSVLVSFNKAKFKEKLFMSLNVPKGVEVAVIVLMLASGTFVLNDVGLVLDLALLFILYSVVLSTVVTRFTMFFLGTD